MTVRELINELEKLPQDSTVTLCVDQNFGIRELCSVEYRGFGLVHLNDKYWTPYAEEGEN